MLKLRFPFLWFIAGCLLFAFVAYKTLAPATGSGLVINDKLAHGAAYFSLVIWFTGLYPRRRYFAVAIVLFALGAALDVLQLGTATRQFELLDVMANAGGIAVGILAALWISGGWCKRLESWLLGAFPP